MITKVTLTKEIEYLEKNEKSCSINCQFARKSYGTYDCELFDVSIENEEGEDNEAGLYGENDRGYGFVRCDECIKSEAK